MTGKPLLPMEFFKEVEMTRKPEFTDKEKAAIAKPPEADPFRSDAMDGFLLTLLRVEELTVPFPDPMPDDQAMLMLDYARGLNTAVSMAKNVKTLIELGEHLIHRSYVQYQSTHATPGAPGSHQAEAIITATNAIKGLTRRSDISQPDMIELHKALHTCFTTISNRGHIGFNMATSRGRFGNLPYDDNHEAVIHAMRSIAKVVNDMGTKLGSSLYLMVRPSDRRFGGGPRQAARHDGQS